jgi:hypothetical protein
MGGAAMTAANYDFKVAAAQGSTARVEAPGRFCYYLSGSAGGLSERIRVKHPASGLAVLLMPGQAFELPDGAPVGASSWLVENADGQAAIGGVLVIGSGAFKDNRLSGVVGVVDGGKARTRANQAFWGSAHVPATVSAYGAVQLWNAAGSGKVLIVEKVGVGLLGGSASPCHVGFLPNGLPGGVGAGYPKSKLASGSATAAQLITATAAGTLFPWMVDIYAPATDTKFVPLNEPIAVPPGYGLCVDCGTPNQSLSANFEFYEDAV